MIFKATPCNEQYDTSDVEEKPRDDAELNALRKGFPGESHFCGTCGHKISECQKKDEKQKKFEGKPWRQRQRNPTSTDKKVNTLKCISGLTSQKLE